MHGARIPGRRPQISSTLVTPVPGVVVRVLLGEMPRSRRGRRSPSVSVGAGLGDGHRGRVRAGLQLLPLDVELADVDDQGEQAEQDTEDEQDGEDRRDRTAVVAPLRPSAPSAQLRHGMTLSPVTVTLPPSPMRTPSGVTNAKVYSTLAVALSSSSGSSGQPVTVGLDVAERRLPAI